MDGSIDGENKNVPVRYIIIIKDPSQCESRCQALLVLKLIWNWAVLAVFQDPVVQLSFAHLKHLQIKARCLVRMR